MNIVSILYYLLIRPLELIYELIFSLCYQLTGSAVISIVFLSITVGLLCLPLYTRADALQAEANAVEAKLRPWKTKIKKNFKGDEQVMMLQAYYRENNYHPLMMMRSSISLLLQIPFFISAYHMLSSSVALKGTSFGPIADLGAPDGMIRIGAFAINLLPILMTAINIISGTIYSKDLDRKAKIQLYVTALVFLVLLYTSPSGLVLYWTLNNVFSLVKNIIMKLVPSKKKALKTYEKNKIDTVIFVLYAVCNSVLIGLLIPSDMISRAVGSFLMNYRTIHLPYYIWVSFLICLGIFLVWGGIYYYVGGNRKLIAGSMVALTFFSILNYFVFYRNNGDLNRYLHIATYYSNDLTDSILNLLILLLSSVLIYIVYKNKPAVFKYLVIALIAAIGAVSFVNMRSVYTENARYSYIEDQREYPELSLSADEPNVVIIMLDRAGGRLVPYIMNERPDIQEKFDGFTWYSNSLSYAQHTNMAIPALYGGYEYTPSNNNARSDISLRKKHNEALLMMPLVFGENGYHVTFFNPPIANYMEIPDLSLFEDYPYIDAYIANEIMAPDFDQMADDWSARFEHNLFAFSFRCACPIPVRQLLYDDGYYNDLNVRLSNSSYFQDAVDISHAAGDNYDFLTSYYPLVNLSYITDISSDNRSGSLVIINSEATHEPTILEEPSYTPSRSIDNSEYDSTHQDRFILDGIELEIDNAECMGQYQIQAASMDALGNWFDYLREQGVYDNTRIIIVSDHGMPHWLFGPTYDRDGNPLSILNFNCLLMVKDFGQSGFTISDEFVTNADVPGFAFNNLITDPVNPFTGNPLTPAVDSERDNLYFVSPLHNVSTNNGNTFLPGQWYTYDPSSGDIFDESSWEYVGEG